MGAAAGVGGARGGWGVGGKVADRWLTTVPPPRVALRYTWRLVLDLGGGEGARVVLFREGSKGEAQWQVDYPAGGGYMMSQLLGSQPYEHEVRCSRVARPRATTPNGCVICAVGPRSHDPALRPLRFSVFVRAELPLSGGRGALRTRGLFRPTGRAPKPMSRAGIEPRTHRSAAWVYRHSATAKGHDRRGPPGVITPTRHR